MSVADAVKQRADLAALARAAGLRLQRAGRQFKACCPFHREKTPSLVFYVDARPHRFHCYGCGLSGTAIDFVMQAEGVPFAEALVRLARDAGVERLQGQDDARLAAQREAQRLAEAERTAVRLRSAQEIWRAAVHAPGALRPYLSARGLDLDVLARVWPQACPGGVPLSLRYDPRCYDEGERRFGPAMIGCVTNRSGALTGVHRTFLNEAGTAKRAGMGAKAKMKGVCDGGAIRLTPAAPELWIGEGIETVLSAMQALALRGAAAGKAFAAVLSLGNLSGGGRGGFADPAAPKFLPPEGVSRVVIIEDHDERDPVSARHMKDRAADKFARAGFSVARVSPPRGMDFNDLLVAAG